MPDSTVPGMSVKLRALPLVRSLVVTLCALAALVALFGAGAASARRNDSTTTVAGSFRMAARHWGVPQEVLMGLGWVESHWEQREGAPSLDQGYGIMHLVGGPGGTLERSAAMTGLSAESIKSSAPSTIV